MLQLPETIRDPEELGRLCTCRPICKSRRRKWNGKLQETSAELLLERKPINECLRRCRPICKSRRRKWNGKLQETSAELLLERKPINECLRRYPTKVYPNSPCPLFGKNRHIVGREKYAKRPTSVVRVCAAPVDICVDTPYLKFMQLAKKLGAWDMVHMCCAFCNCSGCCTCSPPEYAARDAERARDRLDDMRRFDDRVKQEKNSLIQIMYM